MKTGLFFGSFNPIHIGHLAIANYVVEFTDIQEVWFVVSPLNPFKKKEALLSEYHRLELVNRAIGDDARFKASNFEFSLPQPNYTIDTVIRLQEKHPERAFTILMGADQLPSFHKWKNPEELKAIVNFLVYPRPGAGEHPLLQDSRFIAIDAPVMEISSSFIRKSVKEGLDVRHFLHHDVWKYMTEMNFYSKQL